VQDVTFLSHRLTPVEPRHAGARDLDQAEAAGLTMSDRGPRDDVVLPQLHREVALPAHTGVSPALAGDGDRSLRLGTAP
jgi:hypothetical protein